MKKLINVLFALSLIVTVSCNNSSNKQSSDSKIDSTNVSTHSNAKLEIIYFHSTNRCVTCYAAEIVTKSLLDENFKTQLDNGDITFKSLNIDESENNALIEKYQVGFSTLLLINHQNGKDEVTDFTVTAFKYARNEPDKYKELLKSEINKVLRN